MHRNGPKQESNQATLARVKKEMNEPRMAESTREEASNQITRQKLEKLSIIHRGETCAVRMLRRENDNGKANQTSS
jgi:hypothetical protein